MVQEQDKVPHGTYSKQVEDEVRYVIARRLGLDERMLTARTRVNDSMAVVELVLELEEVFDIEIDDGDVERLCTVDDALTMVRYKLGARASL